MERLSKILSGDAKFILLNSYLTFILSTKMTFFVVILTRSKWEKIQKRALIYICNNFTSSYSELRLIAKTTRIYVNRSRLLVSEVYKCIYELNPS